MLTRLLGMHSRRSCAVCAGHGRELLYRQRFAEFSTEGLLAGYDVVVCRGCGFCFADQIPCQDAFDRYYQVMSKYERAWPSREQENPDRERLEPIVRLVEGIARHGESILEIGCASGYLLHLLRGRGFQTVRGIDPSPACAEIARTHYGVPVRCGTFAELPGDDPGADLIILSGVLEHVHDLSRAVGALATLAGERGRVLITVPDASRYVAGVDAPFQEFSVEHINFFGPVSLARLMEVHRLGQVACIQEDLRVNLRTVTHVIHAVFSREAIRGGDERPGPREDSETGPALRRYIAKSEHEHRAVVPTLQRLAEGKQPVLVWGAGAHTLRLLAASPLSRANVVAIIDSNRRYWGKRVGTIPILSPEECAPGGAVILISSRVYQHEILAHIRDGLHWGNPAITLY